METITRKINGGEYTIVLTDDVFKSINELQCDGNNGVIKYQTKVLGKVIRHITAEYDSKEATTLLEMVSDISHTIEIIESFSAPAES